LRDYSSETERATASIAPWKSQHATVNLDWTDRQSHRSKGIDFTELDFSFTKLRVAFKRCAPQPSARTEQERTMVEPHPGLQFPSQAQYIRVVAASRQFAAVAEEVQ